MCSGKSRGILEDAEDSVSKWLFLNLTFLTYQIEIILGLIIEIILTLLGYHTN
jgi:hypothetical protein